MDGVYTTENINTLVNGRSPLYWAVQKEDRNTIEKCISLGAIVDENDIWDTCIYGNRADSFRFLLSKSTISLRRLGGMLWVSLWHGSHKCAYVLLDIGVKLEDIKCHYDEYKRDHPALVMPSTGLLRGFIKRREACRTSAIVIIGIRRCRLSKSKAINANDINVLKLIAKHIWSQRMNN